MMKGNKPSVLVVEDDVPIRNLITTTLEMEKYKFDTAENGNQAIMLAAANNPDIILMDLGLPDIDGIEVIRKIRTWSVAPIIVISARSDEKDKVAALDVGADDYLTKPFSVTELSARLRATTRRIQYIMHTDNTNESVFKNGNLEIDYSAGVVKVSGEEVHLMPLEYSLLCLLAQNIGKVLTYRFILEKVWQNGITSDISSLRVYMASLRKKLEKDKEHSAYIQTHIGVGYRMVSAEDIS
jgi:two-component system KDP operon response regulator KdpE